MIFLAHFKYGAHRVSLHKHLAQNPTIILHYTACQKLGLLNAAEGLQREEGWTIRTVAEQLSVCHLLLVRWKKHGADPFFAMQMSKKKAAHIGLLGQSKSIEPDLLRAIFELHEQGIMVNTFLIVVKALSLSPVFNAKSFTAQCSSAKGFMHAHLWMITEGILHGTMSAPTRLNVATWVD